MKILMLFYLYYPFLLLLTLVKAFTILEWPDLKLSSISDRYTARKHNIQSPKYLENNLLLA